MYRGVSAGLIFGCLFVLSAQESQTPALKVEVLEGDGAINSIRLRRAHDPVVRVTDSAGQPVVGATVLFMLPSTGASGVFADGQRSFTAQTDSQGRAAGQGLRPNAMAGQFQIRVTATSHGVSGAATLAQTNADPVLQSGHTRLIVILAAVAGAAVAGGVLAARGGASSPATSPASPASPGGSISAGTPSFGPPH